MAKAVEEWVNKADAYMLKNYRITLTEDAGVERSELERALTDGMTPEEFCKWFAAKYDLESVEALRLNWML